MRKLLIIFLIAFAASTASAATTAETTASTLNVRKIPGGAVIFTLSRGVIVDVLEVKGEWAQIRPSKPANAQKAQLGWVSVQYLKSVTPEAKAVVTASKLNVRKTPDGPVMSTLSKGTMVSVLQEQGKWTQIVETAQGNRQEAEPGWVSTKHLQPVEVDDAGDRNKNGPRGCHCKMDNDTGAQVCISVSDTKLGCRESYDTVSYRSCRVDLRYGLSTNYEGNAALDTAVTCTVGLVYNLYGSDAWQSDAKSDQKTHILTVDGKTSGEMAFDFSFDPKVEVINVKIESAACKIDGIKTP